MSVSIRSVAKGRPRRLKIHSKIKGISSERKYLRYFLIFKYMKGYFNVFELSVVFLQKTADQLKKVATLQPKLRELILIKIH